MSTRKEASENKNFIEPLYPGEEIDPSQLFPDTLEERRLRVEVRERLQQTPEYRLAQLEEKKRKADELRQRRQSPEFFAEAILPRKERMQEIEEACRQIVRSAFARCGALAEPGNVDLSCSLDDLRERFERLAAEWVRLSVELHEVRGLPVPQPPPGMPPRPVRADISVQGLLWLNHIAATGWHAYSGDRDLPAVYIAPPRRRRE